MTSWASNGRRSSRPAGTVARSTLIALFAVMPLACRHSPESSAELAPKPASSLGISAKQTIRSSRPEATKFTPELRATGTLKPKQSAQLSVAVPGTLQKIFARKGQELKAGAVLATLASSSARAALNQSAAGIGVAQAQLAVADDELKRTAALLKSHTLTEAQFVQAKGQRDVAAAQLEAARAQWKQAAVFLDHHTLKAPFAGVVVSAPDSTGIQVDSEATLFVVEDVSSLVLEASLTQDEAREVSLNSAVSIEVLETGARVDSATLRTIVLSVDPTTNRVPIEIEVPNPERRLLPHTVAQVRLPSAGRREAYRVRDSALTQHQGAFSLWMAEPDGKVIAPRVRVLAQLADGHAVVDPGPNGFPQAARVLDSPPAGIVAGTRLPPEFLQDHQP